MRDEAFTVDIDVRYNDVDLLGHVNNALYSTYLETARVEYLPEVLGTPDALDIVLAHVEIDFERPITLDDDVEVAIQATDVGNTTITFEYVVWASGEVAATGETVQVLYDTEERAPRPVPDEWRERIEAFEGL